MPGVGNIGLVVQRSGLYANGVVFDGTNDYLTKSGAWIGISDSKLGSLSFWFRRTATGVTENIFLLDDGNGNSVVRFDPTDKLTVIFGRAGTTSTALSVTTNTTFNDTNWHHVAVDWSMNNPANRSYYVDGVVEAANWSQYLNQTLRYDVADYSIGANPSGVSKFTGELAELYFNAGVRVGFDNAVTRAQFIDNRAKPVFLGSDGSRPTGTAPILFLTGKTDSWHTNKGTGGGFTENGALTTSATSPSD